MILKIHNIKITKMKKIIINIVTVFALFLMASCQEESKSFGALDAPVNLLVTAQIVGQNTTDALNGDGTGKVLFTATADNAISYRYILPLPPFRCFQLNYFLCPGNIFFRKHLTRSDCHL